MRKAALALIPLAADPTIDLSAGSAYYNTTTKRIRTYDGTSAWFEYGAGGTATPATTVTTENGLDAGAVGASTNYAREDHKHAITNLVDLSSAQTVGGAKTLTGLLTANAGLSIPSGQQFVVGNKKTISGSVSFGAVANAAGVIGQFTSVSATLGVRIHLHLVTGTVQRTKTYEFIVDGATDTTNTYYKLLPADQSSSQSTTSDVFLVCYRPSTATSTWQFWVCTSSTFASTGAVTWSAETYSDSVTGVTYASTLSPATPSPTLPFAGGLHPSNSLDTVGGLVGIGTDAPSSIVDIKVASGTAQLQLQAQAVSSDAQFLPTLSTGAYALFGYLGVAGHGFTGTGVGDLAIGPNGAGTVHIGGTANSGTGTVAAGLRVTASDAQINDNGTFRSLPRGRVGFSGANNTSTGSITTTETAGGGLTNVTFTAVTGRKYRINYSYVVGSSVANDPMVTRIRDGAGSAPTNTSTALASTIISGSATASNSVRVSGHVDVDCVASGATAPGQINAGTHNLGAFVARTGGTGSLFIGSATPAVLSEISIDDVTA